MVCDGTRQATLEMALAVHATAEKTYGKTRAVIAISKSDLLEQWELPQETEKELAGRGGRRVEHDSGSACRGGTP